jgi:DNA polymerase delta subunit 1
MAAATDPFVKTVLNCKQLAIKVSMNSIYGFTGAVVGALPCLAISQSVTGCGRQMIEQTSRLARERFGCTVVYGDTDSCYVIFPEPVDADGTLTTLFKVAARAAKEISETFRKPIELEFEKFMYPLILVAKKRYMYLEWTEPEHHNGEIEAKGVELVRRDNCPYVKETLDACLTPIMFKNNLQLGREKAEEHIDRLLNGEVDVKKLILSKTLKNEYKGYRKIYDHDSKGNKLETYKWEKEVKIRDADTKKQVTTGKFIDECPNAGHVALVEKMIARDPNSAPKPGDRVPFVYIDIGNPKAKGSEKTEDPNYVIANKLPIDTLYYLDHQLMNPIKTIFDILLGPEECQKMFERKSFQDAKRRAKVSIGNSQRIKEKNHDIRSFFAAK